MTEKIIVLVAVLLVIAFIVWWFFGRHQVKSVTAMISGSGETAVQTATVTVSGGYVPSVVVLKKGVPTQLVFHRQDPSTCLERVVFPDFGVNDFLPQGQDHVVSVTATQPGEYGFACGMNMFHGKLIVK